MEYIVVKNYDIEMFVQDVQHQIDEGWTCQGGLIIYNAIYHQVMIKHPFETVDNGGE